MDALALARIQFAVTTIYHFFFVPLTLGLSVLVALMETVYARTGQDVFRRMTKFWGTLFVINFVMGVVTGIVQEFQFGMNWSEYSRFVGDIFGAPLAIEALLTFFLESTFLGIWIFGWDKLSRGVHAGVMWLIALGSNLSALWILIANSFMQNPVGFTIEDGRAVMTDFLALILNPNVWVMFPHTMFAGFTTAAFFVMGISSYFLINKKHIDLFKRSFQIAAIIGSISIVLVAMNGHEQAQYMVEIQPMKMAATEAVWTTESPASLSILTIGDLAQRNEIFSIRIPRLLCLLSFNQLDCEIAGINDLQALYEVEFGPGNYIPPVAVTYWSFRIMVGAGIAMLGLALYGLFMVMGGMFEEKPRILRLYIWAIILPYIANTAGWILTEFGRYPWVVYGLMKIEQGVSNMVSAWQVLTSLLGFTLIYGVLMIVSILLLQKYAKAGPEDPIKLKPENENDSLPSLVGAQD
jgi:cytochrome d ubiquinol oxidase subunit I